MDTHIPRLHTQFSALHVMSMNIYLLLSESYNATFVPLFEKRIDVCSQ